MEESIFEHCTEEATRPDEEASQLYRKRLEQEISCSLITPNCTPLIRIPESEDVEWVRRDRIAMKKGFSFYHHSQEKLLSYSMKHRGDPAIHVESMKDFHLIEYPGVEENQSIYMVGDNGHHRSLVYACIGFLSVLAHVQKAPTRTWIFSMCKHKRSICKIVTWFSYLGLIERKTLRENNVVLFQGKHNLAACLLPNDNLNTLTAMLEDVQNRADAINSKFGLDPELVKLFHSRVRSRLSLEWAWLINGFRVHFNDGGWGD